MPELRVIPDRFFFFFLGGGVSGGTGGRVRVRLGIRLIKGRENRQNIKKMRAKFNRLQPDGGCASWRNKAESSS